MGVDQHISIDPDMEEIVEGTLVKNHVSIHFAALSEEKGSGLTKAKAVMTIPAFTEEAVQDPGMKIVGCDTSIRELSIWMISNSRSL